MSGPRIVAGIHAVREALRGRTGEVVVVYLADGPDRETGRRKGRGGADRARGKARGPRRGGGSKDEGGGGDEDAQAALRKDLRVVADEARRRGIRIEPRTKAELDALAEGHKHQGAVAIAGPYPYVSLDALLAGAADPPLLIALDQITDPHNFGAIVRSAVVLGADGVIVLERRAAPVTPVVVRASAGATEHARIAKVVNLSRTLDELHARGLSSVGLDAGGEVPVDELPPAPAGRVLVVGAEGKGLRRLVRERCELLARIDQVGPVASLNASVAAGIALHAAMRQRRGDGGAQRR